MKAVIILMVSTTLAGCVIIPDTFALTVRSGDRTEIQGMNFGLTWSLKPRIVRAEYISLEGGIPGGEAP